MKKKYMILLIAFILIVGIAAAIIAVKSNIEKNLDSLADLSVSEVDPARLKDGIYTGSYKAFPVSAEVRVTISGHKIVDIDLIKHNNGQGIPAEIIPGKVVEAQSLGVDIVSGATYSSKVILKAIEDAINSAYK